MPQTPNSSPISYLTIDEFINFKDVRAIGELASDTGARLTQVELQTNARVNAIILGASGEVESALLTSQRYLTQDLSAPNGASSQFLKQIVADIAFYRLYTARDGPNPPETVVAGYDDSMHKLTMLATGERILSFQQSAEAGVVSDVFMTAQDYYNDNRFTDNCQRVLGIRNELRRGTLGRYH